MKISMKASVLVNVVLMLLALTCILPLLLLVTSSFATETSLMENGYSFWPSQWGWMLTNICGIVGDKSLPRIR